MSTSIDYLARSTAPVSFPITSPLPLSLLTVSILFSLVSFKGFIIRWPIRNNILIAGNIFPYLHTHQPHSCPIAMQCRQNRFGYLGSSYVMSSNLYHQPMLGLSVQHWSYSRDPGQSWMIDGRYIVRKGVLTAIHVLGVVCCIATKLNDSSLVFSAMPSQVAPFDLSGLRYYC